MRYSRASASGSATVALPDAEAREYRITLEIVFTYPFYLSDLGA